FFSSRRRHTIFSRDWSSDVCSSDLVLTKYLLQKPVIVHAIEVDKESVEYLKTEFNVQNKTEAKLNILEGDFLHYNIAEIFKDERSEERRVGKEYRIRGSPGNVKKRE